MVSFRAMGVRASVSARRWLGAVTCLSLLAIHGPAFAQTSSDDLARTHFESGAAYLEESDYDNALQAFQKSYALSKRPEILLNIATVHERKADLPAAVAALQQFLSVAPANDEHIDATKLRIQNLEKRIADAPAPAPGPTTPAPVAAPPPAAPTPAPAPAAEPHRSRLPAYIVLGVGGLAVGGALVTGIIAKGKYDDAKSSCSPACSDAELSSSRSLALTSTILTGVAVVAAGVGITLLLTSPAQPAQVSYLPRLDVGAAPGAARAQASWSF